MLEDLKEDIVYILLPSIRCCKREYLIDGDDHLSSPNGAWARKVEEGSDLTPKKDEKL